MSKSQNSQLDRKCYQKGFTLVEMMVAVSLFAVVMLVSVGSLLALIDASRRAQNIQSVMNNLNIALDGMVRALRMGNNYVVSNNNHELSFTPFGKPTETWRYKFEETTTGSEEPIGRIYKIYNVQGVGLVNVPLTAKEVDIDYVQFYKTSDTQGDTRQPRVVMIVRGKAGFKKQKTTTKFDIQASATQRLLDI